MAAVFIGALTLLTYLVLHVWPWGLIVSDGETQAVFVDLVKVSLAVSGGMGAAVALVVAYRRQKHLEVDDAGKRSRYAGAAQQLGDPQAAVRMAGAYAMAHLADEWPEQRQQCVDVLCAYLRLPWVVDDPASVEPTSVTVQRAHPITDGGQHTETRAYNVLPGEREVRRTLTRIITDHLRDKPAVSWAELRLDLDGATLIDADFSHARLGVGSSMRHTHFVGHADFGGATFSGFAGFTEATFTGDAVFYGAKFSGYAVFDGARFSGDAGFTGAIFSGGATLFDGARFSGRAGFTEAIFSGRAGFTEAKFSGPAVFDGAKFSGPAVFDGAAFTEYAHLTGAAFTEYAGFTEAAFTGTAGFTEAAFTGTAVFTGAAFTGTAVFTEATFTERSVWRRARLPSREVFDACQRPPTPEALDEAIFEDEQPRPTED
ncbi:MAG: pentapeptide repeat-containing protein [Intrasporangium sp.]|uniref:pentapeptide repeat-containing protein n=1 Tax=Intrasporangium sp. TaxID=1925024 RepID=UPI0026471BE7|nr:pentapeptide repeat-containing protein [Intrasporangium sp.]MDN5797047.1 pentapeptide repeat-containing protein [Intrasporangium sp.]